jgi:hypothetical protein
VNCVRTGDLSSIGRNWILGRARMRIGNANRYAQQAGSNRSASRSNRKCHRISTDVIGFIAEGEESVVIRRRDELGVLLRMEGDCRCWERGTDSHSPARKCRRTPPVWARADRGSRTGAADCHTYPHSRNHVRLRISSHDGVERQANDRRSTACSSMRVSLPRHAWGTVAERREVRCWT